jgi:hypothetical protein
MVESVQVDAPERITWKFVGHETPPKWLEAQAEFFRSRSEFHTL